MSPEPSAVTFRPAPIGAVGAPARRDDDERRAAGYAAGWAAGARAAAEAAEVAERLRAVAAAAAEARRDAALAQAVVSLRQAAEAVAVRQTVEDAALADAVHAAALELAEAVLGHELRPGPDSARALLGRALALPADAGLHTVRVSPDDLVHLRAVLAAGDVDLPEGVRLLPDPALQPGDVVAEHAVVVLDGRIRAALARARAVLEDA